MVSRRGRNTFIRYADTGVTRIVNWEHDVAHGQDEQIQFLSEVHKVLGLGGRLVRRLGYFTVWKELLIRLHELHEIK